MNDTFRYTLLPVILGANFRARLLAERYRRLYRVRSLVLHATYSPWLLFSLALRYRKLNRCGSHAEFMLHDLIRLAEDHPDKLLVLIATTPQDNAFLADHRQTLEKYFVLADRDLSFLVREPLSNTEFITKGERA